jgi:5-formyltetrahydrofolate cyclo-ligase
MPKAASPGCSERLREVDAAEIKAWRRSERQRLLALRTGVSPRQRHEWGRKIEARLHSLLNEQPGIVLGVYWPFQAEFDPRRLIDWFIAQGSAVALPAVVDKKGPLEYRAWRPGEPLVDGVWNIPVPQQRNIVIPRAVLAPLVGFDRQCYRLGYGGGYFDRTLAALAPRPWAIGVGFELSQIETIYPQPFDIPMDIVVTESQIRRH